MVEDSHKSLLGFVTEMIGERYLKVEEDFGSGFVKLKLSEADRRQAKHDIRTIEDVAIELLRNARDARSNVIFFATSKENAEIRHVAVVDDGEGIPRQLHEKVFEPRVTSRLERVVEDEYGVHGRGMALYAIKEIAKASSIACSAPAKGTSIVAHIELKVLPERKDQSTFPQLRREGGKLELSGAHNLPRTVTEFAISNRDIEIYFGSQAEVLSTAYWLSRPLVGNRSYGELVVNPDVKFWQCTGCFDEAVPLAKFARERLGLGVSERNASRILRREIRQLKPIIDMFDGMEESTKRRPVILQGAIPAAGRISVEDLDSLSQEIARSFERVGEKYFLTAGKVEIKREKGVLRVSIEIADKEPT